MPQVSAAMAAHRQFILYRAEPITDRPGKTSKLPIDWRSGRICSAHDPNVWLSHVEAEQHAMAWGPAHGVGFVFTEGCGLWFLDIDECLEPSGQWSPLAVQLLTVLSTCAVEVSRSGRGLHVFGSGALPPHSCKNTAHHLELYHTERFVALTGASLQGDAATVPAPEVLQWLADSYFPPAAGGAVSDWRTDPVREWSGPTDDEQLLQRLLRAPVSAAAAFGAGVSFRDLWECNADALARRWPSASGDAFDRSSADAALASHLAWATGNNHERMRSLMQRSGLVRDKWEREGYVADTVQRMAARTTRWLADRVPAVATNGTHSPDVVGLSFQAAAAGAIPPTLVNLQAALRSAEGGVQLAYDAFRDRIVLGGPGAWRMLTDVDYVTLRSGFEAKGFKPVSADLMRDAVLAVAMSNPVDTAAEWAGALVWDGVPRVADSLVHYFGAAAGPYARAVGLYLWSALAGRCLSPGCQADMVPVLIGPEGLRKTSAVAAIAPTPEAFCEVNLEKLDDDLSRKLRGKLVGELAELRGLKGRDSQSIRAWLTRRTESWTPKYREFESSFLRRCVFVGTSNPRDILSDPEGNRRWLPIDVTAADDEALTADRDQLWAEGVALWRQNGVMWHDAQTLAREVHAEFEEHDEWHDAVAAVLAKPRPAGPGEVPNPMPMGGAPFQMGELARLALGLGLDRIDRKQSLRLGAILRKLGYFKGDAWISGRNLKAWRHLAHPKG